MSGTRLFVKLAMFEIFRCREHNIFTKTILILYKVKYYGFRGALKFPLVPTHIKWKLQPMKRQITKGSSGRTLSKQRGAEGNSGYSSGAPPPQQTDIPAIPELPAFIPLETIGFWSWTPRGRDQPQFATVNHTDILNCVNTDANALPD